MINESSLSRIKSHIEGDKDFCILTAYRGGNETKVNKRKNRALASDIRQMGCGFFHLDGYFIEDKGTEDERKIEEDSLFVISNGSSSFARQITKLANDYDQEGVILKIEDVIYYLDVRTNEKFDVGKFHPGRIGEYYSKLKTVHGGTFIFEGIRMEKGILAKYMDRRFNRD